MQIYAIIYVIGLHTTHRAKISYEVILHDQYTQNTKFVATRCVTIINLMFIVYVQAERICNSSMKTT